MASIDVSEVKGLVRVGETADRKGNPVTALEILGQPVLHARGEAPGGYLPEDWEDIFASRLARVLADLLLRDDDPELWSTQSPTGREVSRLSPQED